MGSVLGLFAVGLGVIVNLLWPPFSEAQLMRSASEERGVVSRGARYWTPARVEAARPVPWVEGSQTPAAIQRGSRQRDPGPAGFIPGSLGTGHALGETASSTWPTVPRDEPGAAGGSASVTGNTEDDSGTEFGTADVYDADFVNKDPTLQTLYPWRTIGKLYFNTLGGTGTCTASVISPNDLIVTAAHCCYDRSVQQWHSNFAFVPAMRKIQRPFGTFPFTNAWIMPNYPPDGAIEEDLCLIKLGPNEFAQTVSNTTGSLGLSWNGPNVRHRFAFGYPGNIKQGKFLYECSAEGYAACGDTLLNGMGCPMTYGSSGGPWIYGFKRFVAGVGNFVDSVVSGHIACTGTFGQSFHGARFTSDNIVPLCIAGGR